MYVVHMIMYSLILCMWERGRGERERERERERIQQDRDIDTQERIPTLVLHIICVQ